MGASLSTIWGLDATHFTAHMHLYSISCTCASQLLHITLSPHHLNQTSLQVLAPLKNPFFGRPGKHAAFTPKHAVITPKHAASRCNVKPRKLRESPFEHVFPEYMSCRKAKTL